MAEPRAGSRTDAHAQEPDDKLTKDFVFDALQVLVDKRMAAWRRNAGNELELRLISGQVFVLGDAGITGV